MGKYYPRQAFMISVISVMPFLAAVFVGLRIYGRIRARVRLAWEDYLIIIANVLSVALIVPSVKNTYMWHYGKHIWEVPLRELEPDFDDYHKVLLAFNLLHTPILPLVKASIILLLLRIGSVLVPIRRALYAIFAFNALTALGAELAVIFICPIRTGNTSDPTVWGVKCLNKLQAGHLFVFIVTANLFTDLMIFPIPFLMIYKLHQTKRRLKVIAIASFCLSLCATALGVWRLVVHWDAMINNRNKSDWTYDIVWCLNHAENNVAIIVACMPTLRALILSWITGDKSQATLRASGNQTGGSDRTGGSASTGGSSKMFIRKSFKISQTSTSVSEILDEKDPYSFERRHGSVMV